MARLQDSPAGVAMEMDKRQHVPYQVVDVCERCGDENVVDLADDDYLSYPIIGDQSKVCFCCNNCGNEWTVKVIVRVTLELVP